MKSFKYLLLSFFILIPIFVFAQAINEFSNGIAFTFEEGTQKVEHKDGNTVLIDIKRDTVVGVSVQKADGEKIKFSKSTIKLKADCPCESGCWQDKSAEQLVCICKPCSRGKKGQAYVALDLSY